MCNAALFLTFQKGVPREPHLVERGSRPGLNAALAWSAGALIIPPIFGHVTGILKKPAAENKSLDFISSFGESVPWAGRTQAGAWHARMSESSQQQRAPSGNPSAQSSDNPSAQSRANPGQCGPSNSGSICSTSRRHAHRPTRGTYVPTCFLTTGCTGVIGSGHRKRLDRLPGALSRI